MGSNSRPDYVRASKLRKRITEGKPLSTDDATWFESYEAAKKTPGRPSPSAVNASASEKITYTEERAVAQGDHVHPAAYEQMVRAEGLRADTLLRVAADALVRCNEQYANMMAHLLARTTAIEESHVAMMEQMRESFIGRMEAEGEAIRLQNAITADEGGELAMLMQYVLQAKAQKDAYEQQTPEGRRAKAKRMNEAKKRKAAARKAGKPLGDPT